ncbi:MAG TPA: cytochrome c [Verrucomicrobiae bacterium]|nr:cytochrome c [Verrucomicrobiae bacterium]
MKKMILIAGLLCVSLLNSSAADGKEVWTKSCAKCHGAEGKGETKMGQKLGVKDYSSASVQDALTDAAAVKAVKEGFADKDGKVVMKPSEGLSDDEVKGVVAYLRTLKK